MSNLRKAFDEMVADVPVYGDLDRAIGQARRERRRRYGMLAGLATAAAVVAMVVAVVAGTGPLGSGSEPSPAEDPTTPERSPRTSAYFGARLDAIVGRAPGWIVREDRITDPDYAFSGRCSKGLSWTEGADAGADGGPPGQSQFAMGMAGFPSEAQMSAAVSKLLANLASCKRTAWRIQPIVETGGALAISAGGVAWIQPTEAEVLVLQAFTTAGPPPADVQIAVAEWMVEYSSTPNEELQGR